MNSINYEESIIILFYSFLKQKNIFKELYSKKLLKKGNGLPYFNRLTSNLKNSSTRHSKVQRISDLWLDYGLRPEQDYDNLKTLRLSQLWRFFLLDNMKEIKFNDAEEEDALKSKLRVSIEANGLRESEEIEKYFQKYNFRTKFNI
jgi:hypothetical protein